MTTPGALWPAVTALLFVAANWLYGRAGERAYAHPILLPSVALMGWFSLNEDGLMAYVADTQFFHIFLAAAVVGLAVPLYRSWGAVKANKRAVLAAVAGGSIAGVMSALVPAMLLQASPEIIASLGTKSITTPMAVTVAGSIGGVPSIAAAVVVITGLFAALVGPGLLRALGVDDDVATGLALGTAGHAIGTAEAVRLSRTMGAAAAFAMTANGLATAVLLPLVWG
ncbi:LrgB family protein [Kordiimonas lacus]|uniref:Putative effector of murein hydrolase n=1 Tax=Kordiimonas lacus TaxID=637679 RepID=A0A1G7F1V4_9PROT|nr:LrgB family protein [Kordiimonas lacus]SDE69869.1 Putative effector of murein hydrolase [Kordiimonas lacus]